MSAIQHVQFWMYSLNLWHINLLAQRCQFDLYLQDHSAMNLQYKFQNTAHIVLSAPQHVPFWIDSFHIRQKLSLVKEGVLRKITLVLDLYLQDHSFKTYFAACVTQAMALENVELKRFNKVRLKIYSPLSISHYFVCPSLAISKSSVQQIAHQRSTSCVATPTYN